MLDTGDLLKTINLSLSVIGDLSTKHGSNGCQLHVCLFLMWNCLIQINFKERNFAMIIPIKKLYILENDVFPAISMLSS